MNRPNPASTEDTLFLPDFCTLRMVFAIVLVGQLLAFVVVLAPTRLSADSWRDMAYSSLFIQWVGLSSAVVLCFSRRWLKRLSNAQAGFFSYSIVLLVTLVLSEIGFWLVIDGVVPVAASSFSVPSFGQGNAPAMVTFVKTPQHFELLLRNLGISAIVSAVALRYFYVQHQWKTNLESEHRARIQALQSRIRPHFLFNSMNTIAALTRSDPALAEEVTEDLAELFRVSLGDASVPVSLARELELCRQYLHIEKQRLGERISDRWAIEGLPSAALIPGLSLQPLVENAVYHGIEPATGGGVIEISGGEEKARVWIRISNSRPGENRSHSRPGGNQMAQENVAQRMRAFFGDGADVQVQEGASEYAVELRFPLITDYQAGARTG
jgi:two-component system sensor histidine kinase AlgZ